MAGFDVAKVFDIFLFLGICLIVWDSIRYFPTVFLDNSFKISLMNYVFKSSLRGRVIILIFLPLKFI